MKFFVLFLKTDGVIELINHHHWKNVQGVANIQTKYSISVPVDRKCTDYLFSVFKVTSNLHCSHDSTWIPIKEKYIFQIEVELHEHRKIVLLTTLWFQWSRKLRIFEFLGTLYWNVLAFSHVSSFLSSLSSIFAYTNNEMMLSHSLLSLACCNTLANLFYRHYVFLQIYYSFYQPILFLVFPF